jgi:hypothetical protein
MITGGGHGDNVSTRENKKEHMAKTTLVPFYVRLGNALTLNSSLEEFERAAVSHPLFVLERK